MRKKYLITGSTGFIGSVLLRKLVENNNKVCILLRKESNTWRIKDLLKKVTVKYSDLSKLPELTKIIKEIKPDIIYHLAANGAYSYQNDSNQIISTNILGTWNLLQACNSVNYELFVNTGSSSEYGFKKFAMRETDSLEPTSYYAVTKCTQTLLCNHIAKQEKKPIVTIRPFAVYGPYEEPKRFFPTLMNSFLSGNKIDLVSPNTARDFIFVDDVVRAYLKINELKKNPGECFNIGTGIQSSIRNVVELSQKVIGRKLKLKWGSMTNRKWDSDNWVADISKARRLLNWVPKINLQEGMRLTWNWFQKNHKYYENKT